jgi:hypothetical protein
MHFIQRDRLPWLVLMLLFFLSLPSFSQVAVVVSFPPPALPVYDQPPCPAEGYIWTPGYWAYDDAYGDYYWVPGTWVLAPEVGLLWTPPYWGWGGNGYAFYPGYWGPQVGFYGGVVYGYGYFGHGYEGGRWNNGQFYYNRTVNNVNITNIHNVYNTTVNNVTVNRVSYNGGNGGIEARPTPAEETAMHDRHVPPVAAQNQHVQTARGNPQLRASVNQGRPPVAATPKPGAFNERGVVAASEAGAPYHPPANRAPAKTATNEPAARPEGNAARPEGNAAPAAPPTHAKDVAPHQAPPSPNTGNAKLDQKYQQQQQKLAQQQEQDHQKLAQQQEQQHQKMAQQQQKAAQQQANAARTQQMEQRNQQMEQQHAQQTQQMEQRHAQQQQQLNTRQQPPASRPPAAMEAPHASPEKH